MAALLIAHGHLPCEQTPESALAITPLCFSVSRRRNMHPFPKGQCELAGMVVADAGGDFMHAKCCTTEHFCSFFHAVTSHVLGNRHPVDQLEALFQVVHVYEKSA